MAKKLISLSIIALCLIPILRYVNAQANQEDTRIRVAQLFYSSADVYVDDELLVPHLGLTVTTDYFPLTSGRHTIFIVPSDKKPSSGTILRLREGHSYTIAVLGNATPLVIDETAELAPYDPQGNNVIVIQNVPDAPPIDVWFIDAKAIQNLTFRHYVVTAAPVGAYGVRVTTVADPYTVIFQNSYFAVPNTLSLAYLTGSLPDDYLATFFTTSPDHMYDYLTVNAALKGSPLSSLFELINIAAWEELLSADTPYTLFAPTNSALAALPATTVGAFLNDPVALRDTLSYYLVEGNWTPYELQGEHSLTTLQGGILETVFEPSETHLAVNGIPVVGQHRVSNGIIYEIDSLLLPTE